MHTVCIHTQPVTTPTGVKAQVMHNAAHVAHTTHTVSTALPTFRVLGRYKAHMRAPRLPNTPHQAHIAWQQAMRLAEHKAAARRAYEARLSTRLRKLVRSLSRVCGL